MALLQLLVHYRTQCELEYYLYPPIQNEIIILNFFLRKANNQDEFNDFESSLFDFPSSVSSFMNASQSTSSISSTSTITNVTSNTNGLTNINKNLIQKVILSSTSNVNLIHEILRNVSLTFQRQ